VILVALYNSCYVCFKSVTCFVSFVFVACLSSFLCLYIKLIRTCGDQLKGGYVRCY
jgi:hypothetical protein